MKFLGCTDNAVLGSRDKRNSLMDRDWFLLSWGSSYQKLSYRVLLTNDSAVSYFYLKKQSIFFFCCILRSAHDVPHRAQLC